MHVPFTCGVKVKSICLLGGHDSESGASGPSKLRIFKNAENIDFDSAEDATPTQALDIHEEYSLATYPLRASKFQSVTSLTFHIPDSFDGDATRICFLGIKGEATGELRRAVECVYEASAQLKDHKIPGDLAEARKYNL